MRSPKNAREEPTRAEAAAARLALLAADLSGAEPTGSRAEPEQWWSDHTRVAPARRTAAPPEPVDEPRPAEPPSLPSPGRHAARRRRRPPAVAVPLPSLGPAQLTAVAVAVAVALVVTAWWVLRGQAEPVPPPSAPGTVEPLVAAASEAPADPASPSASGTVTVDVTGKVRRPEIVVLDPGSRVVDALEAAGGARPGVDLAGLNLARMLADGEQIVVGAPAAPVVPGPAGSSTPSAPATLVNLNLATPAELETLPDVGPVTAAAIVTWRDEHGGFTAVDQLLEVDGIGEVTLANLAPYVTV